MHEAILLPFNPINIRGWGGGVIITPTAIVLLSVLNCLRAIVKEFSSFSKTIILARKKS